MKRWSLAVLLVTPWLALALHAFAIDSIRARLTALEQRLPATVRTVCVDEGCNWLAETVRDSQDKLSVLRFAKRERP
jgi:hypothetical protein